MAKTDFKSVDQYIATHPEAVQAVLERVRSTIRKALPDAVETIKYQMPAYELHDGNGIAFAAWKRHFALYGATDKLVAAFSEELARYEVDKGTIRFPYSEPVPVKLIERIAKFRASEPGKRAKARSKEPRRSSIVRARSRR